MKQVKTHFHGWHTVTDEQYEKWADNIRQGATAMSMERREEYI